MFEKTSKTGKTHDMGGDAIVRNHCRDHSVLDDGHKRIKTGLDHLANRLALIERSWRMLERKQSMR